MWRVYALLSALFAALTAIFAKVGVKDVNSDLATAIRTLERYHRRPAHYSWQRADADEMTAVAGWIANPFLIGQTHR